MAAKAGYLRAAGLESFFCVSDSLLCWLWQRRCLHVACHAGMVAGTMLYCLMRLMAVVVLGVVAYFDVLAVLGFKVKEFARRTA